MSSLHKFHRRTNISASVPISNTKLLVNANGTQGQTTFTDNSGNNTLTAFGNAQINTTTKKFGAGSIYLDGSSSFVRISNPASCYFTGDFTVECWAYPLANVNGWDCLFSLSTNSPGWNSSNSNTAIKGLCLCLNKLATLVGNIPYTSTVPLNRWSHVAVVRKDDMINVYIDGVSVITPTSYPGNLGTVDNSAPAIGIFDYYANTYRFGFNGYIDDFRVINGIAAYTANFTPPVVELSII